jgi:hypothetical protein
MKSMDIIRWVAQTFVSSESLRLVRTKDRRVQRSTKFRVTLNADRRRDIKGEASAWSLDIST